MAQIKIHCPEKWERARELSRDHNDQTFANCMLRMMAYACQPGAETVSVSADFDKNSFLFSIYREDGSLSMNGGIIFHGFPESGYQQNGSVQLTPDYGWHIHT